MPRASRPPHAALTVEACWAITIGCAGYVGTTAVPNSIRGTSPADDGEGGEGVVAEDLRRPERGEPVGLGLAGLGDDIVDRAVVDPSSNIPMRMAGR